MATEPTYHYSFEDIQRYINNQMPPEEMNALEKAALNDPLLADALDGFVMSGLSTSIQHLDEIHHKIKNSIHETTTDPELVTPTKNTFTRKRLIAAAVMTGILLIGIWFFIKSLPDSTENIAKADKPLRPTTEAISAPPKKDSTMPLKNQAKNHAARTDADSESEQRTRSKKEVTTPKKPTIPFGAKEQIATEKATTRSDTVIDNIAPVESDNAIAGKEVIIDNNQFKLSRLAPNNALRKKLPSSQQGFVTGKIMDTSGKPLSGVTIVNADNKSTVSNQQGGFKLVSNDSVATVSFSAVGYQPKVQQLKIGQSAGIELQPSGSKLEEVVVIGYGQQRKKELTGAITTMKDVDKIPHKNSEEPTPEGGWDHFYSRLNSYLGVDPTTANKLLELHVTIRNGKAAIVKVKQSPSGAISQKAISFIKNETKWNSFKMNKEVIVSLNVN